MDNLENLMTLKNDMKKKDWTICDFFSNSMAQSILFS